jgi:hypothetical protein
MIVRIVPKFVCVLLVAALSAPALAAPGLLVTKPPAGGPVQPVPSWTGPSQDPHAVQGQWFKDLTTGAEHVKPYEFYDNVEGHGGGFKQSLAIEGYVQNLVYDATGNITGFGVQATITNDMRGTGQWQEAIPGNLHDEWRQTTDQYQGPMWQVKLTTEFADDGTQGNLPAGGPYLPEQNIYAIDYDQMGWYCWTPDPSAPQPAGNYWVPTYDFGNIAPGASATRNLGFGLYTAVAPGSALFLFLEDAETQRWDVFMNRTTSLKISQYVDNFFADPGTPYPAPPHSSDVSVFFIPEPTSLVLLVLSGLVLLRRRST